MFNATAYAVYIHSLQEPDSAQHTPRKAKREYAGKKYGKVPHPRIRIEDERADDAAQDAYLEWAQKEK